MSITSGVLGQSALNERYTFSLAEGSVVKALDQIALTGGLVFSYNPEALPQDPVVDVSFQEQKLNDILARIIGENYRFIQRGKYIIIQARKATKTTKLKVAGTVVDAQSGEELSDASIFDANTLSASLSDDQGQYNLFVSRRYEAATFIISKQNYKDTLIRLMPGERLPEKVTLQPSNQSEAKGSPVDKSGFFKTFVADKIRKHMQNVTLGEERPLQLSLFPVLGTNGLLSGKITNYVSLNATIGVAYGVKAFEVAGAGNIVRNNVKGVQLAGGLNIVGNETAGLQMAGGVNLDLGSTRGTQFAGALNINRGEFEGAQFAGAINNSRDTKGLQAAGFGNWSDDLQGWQLAGALNYAHGNVKGVQLAGAINYTKDDVSGVQISSLLNYAWSLSGVQIGLVNVVNEDRGGVSIGLINIIKNGLKKLEISHNDVTAYNLSFRMGTETFYSFLAAGIQPHKGNFWSYGLGFGTQFSLPKEFFANVEVSSFELRPLTEQAEDINHNLNKLNINLGIQLKPSLALIGGPVLNIAVRDRRQPDPFSAEPDWLLAENNDLSMWLGYRLGVRF